MNINHRHFGIILFVAAAYALAASCAKESSLGLNDLNKSYFDSWMHVNHPDLQKTGLGIYILEDTPGTGELVTDDDYYIFARYTYYDLDGNITGTTEEDVDKQLGSYSTSNYYGSDIIFMDTDYSSAGLMEIFKGMRVGGTRTAIIPGWLNATASYDTEEDYLKNCTGTDAICKVTLEGKVEDIYEWEIDTLERFTLHQMADVDSTVYGYYYQQLVAPKDTTSYPNDTSFYINYTGRLLNGKVFDTTIKDTAKFYGIYSATKSYAPVCIKLNEDFTEITMSSSSSSDGSTLVNGFSYCLSQIGRYEKGRVAFYSGHGYGYTGSSPSIPKYAPICFDIEVVDEPE